MDVDSPGAAYVLLDTNILLHFPPPDQVDWTALCRSPNVILVIYPLLRTELSNAKDMHPGKHLRKRAGDRGAWLRERLAKADQHVRPGVRLLGVAKEPRQLVEELGLDRSVSDDMIIAHAVALQREGKTVFVATADGGLEMKLEDRGIPVLVLDDRLRLAPEPDPEKQRADNAERELKALRNRLPVLEAMVEQREAILRQCGYGLVDAYVHRAIEATQAAYSERQLEQHRTRYPFLNVENGNVPVHSIHHQRFQPIMEEAQRFLREEHGWLTRTEGAALLSLAVRNSGTCSATDVRLRLSLPVSFTLHHRSAFGSKPRLQLLPPEFAGLPVASGRADIDQFVFYTDGPGSPSIKEDRRVVEFTWPRIQQDAAVSSAGFWITASSDADTGCVQLRYEILCEERGDKLAGTVSAVVADDSLTADLGVAR